MTARELAYVKISVDGVESTATVDGRLGSGQIPLLNLRKTRLGRQEIERLCKLGDRWVRAFTIAFNAADKHPLTRPHPELPYSSKHFEKVGELKGWPILRRIEEGDPDIKIVGEVGHLVLLSTTHTPRDLHQLIRGDGRFRGMQVMIIGEGQFTVTKEALKPVEHLFERDESLQLHPAAEPPFTTVSKHRMALHNSGRDARRMGVSSAERGDLTAHVGEVIQLGRPRKDRLTQAVTRFNKQARKFGKQLVFKV